MAQTSNQQDQRLSPGRLLTPQQRRMLATLRLEAARVVRGLAVGMHRAVGSGSSVQFREHRPYVPGDALRQLDWKLYGKTDRLYIKQFEDESDRRFMLLIDQSGSMAYPVDAKESSEGANDTNKHSFARRIAAALAMLCVAQQDRVGLLTFDRSVNTLIAPKCSRAHLAVLLGCLVESNPKGETSLAAALLAVSQKLHHRRSTVVVLSDLFDDSSALLTSVRTIVALGHEIVLVHILHDDELDFPFSSLLRFHCLERSAEPRTLDAGAIAASYRSSMAEFTKALSTGCRELKATYLPCRTSEDPIQVLRRFTERRPRLRRRSS